MDRKCPNDEARLSRFVCLVVLLLAGRLCAADPPNVLLICVDDLRCSLGCYGDAIAKTPHIDQLAREGRVFLKHYTFCAACGPSRSSMLSGRRTLDWDYLRAMRERAQRGGLKEPTEAVSLPHLFRQHGYRTVAIGKVSHQPGGVVDPQQTIHELPFSWDESFAPTGKWQTPWRAFFGYADGSASNKVVEETRNLTPKLPYEWAPVDDEGYPDGLNARAAIEKLRELAPQRQPFFLAVGFYKPHLPFNAPKKYWDLYDREKISPAPWPRAPENLDAPITLHDSYEPTTHYRWPSPPGIVSEEQGRILKHGYYAAVSYVDQQIGKVLDEYRRLDLEKNTIVVLWSDHGWHLGDHGIWGKATNYEWALRSPLIMRVPNQSRPGESAAGIVDGIDLYPTLATLCGLPLPSNLEGANVSSLIENPDGPGRGFVISYSSSPQARGMAIRTEHHRIVKWHIPQLNRTMVELYDHRTDPNESRNVAAEQPGVAALFEPQLNEMLGLAEPRPNAAILLLGASLVVAVLAIVWIVLQRAAPRIETAV